MRGRVAVLVSDGLGPIHDAIAALRSLRAHDPSWLVFATPFCRHRSQPRLVAEADALITVIGHEPAGSVYQDSHRPDDAEIVELLRQDRL